MHMGHRLIALAILIAGCTIGLAIAEPATGLLFLLAAVIPVLLFAAEYFGAVQRKEFPAPSFAFLSTAFGPKGKGSPERPGPDPERGDPGEE